MTFKRKAYGLSVKERNERRFQRRTRRRRLPPPRQQREAESKKDDPPLYQTEMDPIQDSSQSTTCSNKIVEMEVSPRPHGSATDITSTSLRKSNQDDKNAFLYQEDVSTTSDERIPSQEEEENSSPSAEEKDDDSSFLPSQVEEEKANIHEEIPIPKRLVEENHPMTFSRKGIELNSKISIDNPAKLISIAKTYFSMDGSCSYSSSDSLSYHTDDKNASTVRSIISPTIPLEDTQEDESQSYTSNTNVSSPSPPIRQVPTLKNIVSSSTKIKSAKPFKKSSKSHEITPPSKKNPHKSNEVVSSNQEMIGLDTLSALWFAMGSNPSLSKEDKKQIKISAPFDHPKLQEISTTVYSLDHAMKELAESMEKVQTLCGKLLLLQDKGVHQQLLDCVRWTSSVNEEVESGVKVWLERRTSFQTSLVSLFVNNLC